MSASAAVGKPKNALGGYDYNHSDDQEYKRLRDLAKLEYKSRERCFAESKRLYSEGDHAGAKEFSNKGKEHDAKMDNYNSQAAAYVFRENNADSKEDEIDLHGLFVKESEEYLMQRIKAGISRHERVLKVIVGKGNHSEYGISKLKPSVEKLCQENGLRYKVDEKNSGVIDVFLTEIQEPQGPHMPISNGYPVNNNTQYQQPQYQQPQQTNNNNDIVDILCGVFKLFRSCFS